MSWVDTETMLVLLRLVVAGLLSGVIGLEREVKRHPAGFRTHLLVGVGSCMMMVLSVFGFEAYLSEHPNITGFDPSRLPSYVVSGIGFLGAGTILVHGVTVRGLTTAASIWVVAGIGLVVGIGMYYVAIFATVIVILSLIFLHKWESLFIKATQSQAFFLLVQNKQVSLSRIVEIMEDNNVKVEKVSVEKADENNSFMKYNFTLIFPNNETLPRLYDTFSKMDAIEKVFTEE